MVRHNRDAATTYDLRTSGSWRAIQPYDTQALFRLGTKPTTGSSAAGAGGISGISGIWVFVIIITVIFVALIAYL